MPHPDTPKRKNDQLPCYTYPMQTTTISQASFQQASRYLLTMRLSMVTAELIVLAFAIPFYLFHIGLIPATITSLSHLVFAFAANRWMQRSPPGQDWPVSLSLLADLILLGVWLYFTGGYTNPLTSLLLLPLAMAIILVPMPHGLMLACTSVLIYRLLMFSYEPAMIHAHDSPFLEQLHLRGMWMAFILTAIVLLLVTGSLVRKLRAQEGLLARAREERLRDEQIIALGLSAATVAHRIGTPLNTMTLLVSDMKQQPEAQGLEADLALLENQLALCGTQLKQLSDAAAEVRDSRLEIISLQRWLQRLRESTTLLWPAAEIQWDKSIPETDITVDATLDQAVLNIIANALRESPDYVRIGARENNGSITLSIEDHGKGLDESFPHPPGNHITRSESGLGIGLFLSNATIQRLGGKLSAQLESSGTTMNIELPEAHHAN